MKKQLFSLAFAAATALCAAGCGGGSGGSSGGDEITRELLADKQWFMISIRGNASYEGGGVDTPCPARLRKIGAPSTQFSCGTGDEINLRNDGNSTYLGIRATWSLDGSTVMLDAGSFGILSGTVSREPVAAGAPMRLRVRQTSRIVNGVRDTGDDGCDFVIEHGT